MIFYVHFFVIFFKENQTRNWPYVIPHLFVCEIWRPHERGRRRGMVKNDWEENDEEIGWFPIFGVCPCIFCSLYFCFKMKKLFALPGLHLIFKAGIFIETGFHSLSRMVYPRLTSWHILYCNPSPAFYLGGICPVVEFFLHPKLQKLPPFSVKSCFSLSFFQCRNFPISFSRYYFSPSFVSLDSCLDFILIWNCFPFTKNVCANVVENGRSNRWSQKCGWGFWVSICFQPHPSHPHYSGRFLNFHLLSEVDCISCPMNAVPVVPGLQVTVQRR